MRIRTAGRDFLGRELTVLCFVLALSWMLPGVSESANSPAKTIQVASIAARLATLPQFVAADALAQQGYRIEW